jgi:hypothetical protein
VLQSFPNIIVLANKILRFFFHRCSVESVVRHYVAEFVKCNTCGSTETELKKENRMNFLHCKRIAFLLIHLFRCALLCVVVVVVVVACVFVCVVCVCACVRVCVRVHVRAF